jgi:hypothetical protein
MLRYLIVFCLVLAGMCFAYRDGSVYGRIKPYNAALHVWAVSDDDTGSAVIANGQFEIKNLRPGRYRIIVEGLYPYKVTTKPDVIVNDSAATDAGEIQLRMN